MKHTKPSKPANDETKPLSLTMQLPKNYEPVHILMLAIDQGGVVQLDSAGSPNCFTYPAVVALMASRLNEALAFSLTLGPTVQRPPTVSTNHEAGRC